MRNEDTMRKKSLFIMAALLLCLVLAGCAGKKEKEEDKEGDIKGAILMAVGEEAVSCQEAMAYLYLLKRQYESGMGEGIWSFQIGEDKTLEDYAKESVISNLTQLKIICQQAQEEGISLSEEESYEAAQAARQLLKTVKEEDIGRFELTEDTLTTVYADNALAAKFFDAATAQVDTNISDEEAKQITIQYVAVITNGTDGKEKAKERAEKLRKEAKKASSFLNFASSNSDLEEVEQTFGKADMPEEFGQAAMELEKGELSSVIEGKKGYYILYCITDYNEDATAAKKEEIIDKSRDQMFREKYEEWSKKYKVVVSSALWDEFSLTQENT